MIKYILSAGAGILLCSFARSQQTTNVADPAEIKLAENNYAIVAAVVKEKNSYGLPGNGSIAGHADAVILYSGTVKKHRLHGSWRSWYNNQNLCDSGTFVKGVPDGEWKHWDANGQLLTIRHYDAEKLLRIKNEMHRSHPKNVLYPLVALFNKNSRRAKRYLEAGYSFTFTSRHIQGFSLQQAVENNIAPGSVYQPLFDECLHHGLYMNFFSNGTAKDSGYYKNGLRDGIWIHTEAAGNSYLLGAYKNGIRQGDWKQYDASDKLMTIIYYNKKGEEEWRKKIRD
jgi:antitoxin component YwqK of YwqJK toxin-antitoxin module